MVNKHYEYLSFNSNTTYYFQSEGKQGIIPKVIVFTPLEDDDWNLAFGDLYQTDIDDAVISNNHDIVKVLSTIAKVVYEFSAHYPSRNIIIEPVDEKRKKLYNHVFRRNYEDICLVFDVIGTVNGKKEAYSSKKTYDIFKLKRKFVQ